MNKGNYTFVIIHRLPIIHPQLDRDEVRNYSLILISIHRMSAGAHISIEMTGVSDMPV